MKKRLTALSITVIVALSISLFSFTAFAGTAAIGSIGTTVGVDGTGINNLGFLYSSGDVTNAGTLKTEVTELNTNPFTDPIYNIMYLGYEAGHTDTFADTGGNIFTNNITSPGNIGTVNTTTGFFKDTIDSIPLAAMFTGTDNLKIFGITPAFFTGIDTPSNLYLDDTAKMIYSYYVVGFGDGLGDNDFDDLVIAVRAGARSEVPIPGAIWLLGSGILGLVGIRRRNKA